MDLQLVLALRVRAVSVAAPQTEALSHEAALHHS